MTEKRFWCLEEYEGETSPIVDGKFAPTNGWLCNRLNELYKENEQLKKEIDKLKHRHSLLHDVCIEAECDRDRYHKDVVSLEKEMEQLKSTNMEMEDYLGRLEEENINIQIKLQKIRDYAKEDGEVKQGIIEKVILNE